MKRTTILLAVLMTAALAAQTGETVDSAAIAKIRDEGLNRSQVMETMFWLTDRYGPRLTGSTEFEEAGDWAVKQLQDWGVANVKKERFPFGRGWSLVEVSRDDDRAARDADYRPAEVVDAAAPTARSPRTSSASRSPTRRMRRSGKGKLRGKIVLTQPAREVRMLDRARSSFATRDDPKWMEEALSMPAPRGRGAGAAVAAAQVAAGAAPST